MIDMWREREREREPCSEGVLTSIRESIQAQVEQTQTITKGGIGAGNFAWNWCILHRPKKKIAAICCIFTDGFEAMRSYRHWKWRNRNLLCLEQK
jgi:hypothetical protein